jgi:cytochrome c peroxidase
VTRHRSTFRAVPTATAALTRSTSVATLVITLMFTLVGCAPSGRTGSKGEVVEIETIEAIPAADQAQKNTKAVAIDEEAAKAKKTVDAATAAADLAIAEAGKTIEGKATEGEATEGKGEAPAAVEKQPVMEKPQAEQVAVENVEKKTEATAAAPAPAATPAPSAAPATAADATTPAATAAPASSRDRVAPRERVALGDPSLTAGVPGSGPITLEQIDQWLADPKNAVELEPVLPLGLSQGAAQIDRVGLEKNPLTRAKIELGRQLYFDPRLSVDSTVSCASCHNPAEGYSANTKTGVGIRGQLGGRNSPVSFNRILSGPQFWDGRAGSLEDQAVGPLQNPIEMGFTHEGVVKRLGEMPVYKKQFETIFGELSIDRVGQAIAAFERALVTAPSPYDYNEQLQSFAALDPDDIAEDEDLAAKYAAAKAAVSAQPMSDEAKRGREIFFSEKGNCTACHVGANLADENYHNIGIGMDKPEPDLGRFAVTKDPADTGAFKTPTVRNVALSGPYMHDGSVATLEEVVEWYDKGGHPNPHLSAKMRPLKLSAQEKADLVEFMKACTGPTPTVETSRLPAGD